ncbi:protein CASPARIAN STRIP INTEGRITY FACTOR 1-like [Hibiscus syriacus]|uniref:protein CASPARIAN STRIP INTEGRITY FACTOR 1-like n=1 Tax=Hibiscus syriacus TaxID=106335 RepID=UPI001924DA63|nr:protein CASPARIAN STRIP INTEGRITY FACTOR 1-like [Hibiscus syriacus]
MQNKKIVLLFLMVSAFLLSTSMAAGRRPKVINMAKEINAGFEDGDEGSGAHERVLRANTRDYGKYDPSPALEKPPFKFIQN